MKLTAKVKLQPNPDQTIALLRTLETANQACNYISDIAWQARKFNQFGIHHLVYHDIKDRFGLTAQMVVRVISKVADAYKLDKKTKRAFTSHGAIAYDSRILRWYVDKREVSIWTVSGRLRLPFVAGERQLELLKGQRGESDLAIVGGELYLFATCEVEEPDPKDVKEFLGVDLGIVNVATTSDGDTFAGNQINNVRHRHRRLRKKLQQKGTKAARRRLKKLAGKERRFGTDVNHCISKTIVTKAQGTNRAIALERLRGIRDRVRLRKPQRVTLHSWSFHQLGGFIKYKAQRVGIPVIEVDPRNTSRICPSCGSVDKANRKTQSKFSCVSCGFAGHADTIAACNIASRAAVNRPNVSATAIQPLGLVVVEPGTSPRASAVGS